MGDALPEVRPGNQKKYESAEEERVDGTRKVSIGLAMSEVLSPDAAI